MGSDSTTLTRTLVIGESDQSENSPEYQVSVARVDGGQSVDVSDDVYPRSARTGAEVALGLLTPGSYRAALNAPARAIRCDFTIRKAAVLRPCPQ